MSEQIIILSGSFRFISPKVFWKSFSLRNKAICPKKGTRVYYSLNFFIFYTFIYLYIFISLWELGVF